MREDSQELSALLAELSKDDYCYLSTTGRISGRPHEIEIWFGVEGSSLYLLSGGGYDSDWVKNLQKSSSATVRIREHIFKGTARIVDSKNEEMMARTMLAEKYQEWEEGRTLSEWARTALPIAFDLAH